jgi:hypothetical protein
MSKMSLHDPFGYLKHKLWPKEGLGVNCQFDSRCRNPTLAKCGGEAQHLEKVRIWSPPGLPNV